MLRSWFEAKEGTRLLYSRMQQAGCGASEDGAPGSARVCATVRLRGRARDPDACWELGWSAACAPSPAPGGAAIPVSVHLPQG